MDLHAIALQALQADQARVAQVSTNLANALTPGYRRAATLGRPLDASARFEAVLRQLQAEPAAASRPGLAGIAASTPSEIASPLWRDFRAGSLRATGQPLDLALEGPGWFEIATAGGPAYTRNGAFHLDAQGRLVDAQGRPVMGEGGEIVLSRTPTIGADGTVREDGRVVARLRIVAFDDPRTLVPAAGGVYASASAGRPVAAGEVPLRQGHLENANVQPLREMVDLMQAIRRFEAVHRALQIHDELLGTGIRKLGEN